MLQLFFIPLVKYSQENRSDTYVQRTFTEGILYLIEQQLCINACIADNNHGEVVSHLKTLSVHWRLLGQEFCIPEHKMDEIEKEKHERAWDCLNATVTQWLQCNFIEKVKDSKVTPNVDWLIRAVRQINAAHADKLEEGKYQC